MRHGICLATLKEELRRTAKEIGTVPLLTTIDTQNGQQLSYDVFLRDYMAENVPVLITNLADSWPSIKAWHSKDGKPNFTYLKQMYGEATVTVAHCNVPTVGNEKRSEMQFSHVIDTWLQRNPDKPDTCLYVKDWHLIRDYPDPTVYHLPDVFSSDWINEYWINELGGVDDYRFVYVGPKGSWTGIHADVFRSYSWSTNIVGRKIWYLYHPSYESSLKDANGYYVRNVLDYDTKRFPAIAKLKVLKVVQEAGETIFVPSDWHHQVVNVEDTISINHNWANACNIDKIMRHLLAELAAVEQAIEDCRESFSEQGWIDHCQLMLKANAGMNLKDFWQLLRAASIKGLANASEAAQEGSKYHAIFDLSRIQRVLQPLSKHPTIQTFQARGELDTKILSDVQNAIATFKKSIVV